MEFFDGVLKVLKNIELMDYVDIAIVFLLFYGLLPMIRSSGVLRITLTVVFVVIVTGLTELFELYTLNFLMEMVKDVGLIAIVVLYQPELRRILDQLGRVSWKSLLGLEKPVEEMVGIISQTVSACEVLSRERVGALIVFARENSLEEFTKTGTPIQAQVTDQLIRNIFFPKAALHDGAMVIKGGKIDCAGCVLPLSHSHSISADLGTRHRAGVGVSEATDAVVVIVSEETGTISVAVGGVLKRYLAPQTLERLLRNELCRERNEKKRSIGTILSQKWTKEDGNGK